MYMYIPFGSPRLLPSHAWNKGEVIRTKQLGRGISDLSLIISIKIMNICRNSLADDQEIARQWEPSIMFYAILSHDVDAQLDTIWCDHPMKNNPADRRQFLNLQKKFYDQHNCHVYQVNWIMLYMYLCTVTFEGPRRCFLLYMYYTFM